MLVFQLEQSEAALMYDGTRVMLAAFKQLLNEYPAIFAKNFRRGEVYNNNTRGIDCKREKVMPWEHGNEIFHRLRNVSTLSGVVLRLKYARFTRVNGNPFNVNATFLCFLNPLFANTRRVDPSDY